VQLIPIVLKITKNLFNLDVDYQTTISISPLTTTVLRNDAGEEGGIQIYFGSTEIEVVATPITFWQALKDIGGLLSLLFFFAIFAGARHIKQFNTSLKKAYYRATRQHSRQLQMEEGEEGTNKTQEPVPLDDKKLDKEFMEYFSFGRYLELHQRVEYLEEELDRRQLIQRRLTCSNIKQRGGNSLLAGR
jgi:hypothetical protein